jgi:hypothetical protein
VPTVPNISPSQANQMGLIHKSIWRDFSPLTFVRVPAETMRDGWNGLARPSGGWTGFDYCWSQYTLRHGRGASNQQPWNTPVDPRDLIDEQRQIIATSNLNMGVVASVNLWIGGAGQDLLGVTAKWDVGNDGGPTGYLLGDRDAARATEVSTLLDSHLSLAVSPAWIRKHAELMAADPDMPFLLYWQHGRAGGASDEFLSYYQRADYEDAFDDAITFGLARTTFNGWRTAK